MKEKIAFAAVAPMPAAELTVGASGLATSPAAKMPGALVAPGGRVVATHFWRDAPPAQVGLLASERERRFGESALTFYRRQEDR